MDNKFSVVLIPEKYHRPKVGQIFLLKAQTGTIVLRKWLHNDLKAARVCCVCIMDNTISVVLIPQKYHRPKVGQISLLIAQTGIIVLRKWLYNHLKAARLIPVCIMGNKFSVVLIPQTYHRPKVGQISLLIAQNHCAY